MAYGASPRLSCVLGLALLLALGGPVAAEDVLVLKNGRKAAGEIVEETDERVLLKMAGGTLVYPRGMIAEVIHGEAGEEEQDAPPVPKANGALRRQEFGLLYRDGKRVGTRTFRLVARQEYLQFEQELWFAAAGKEPERVIRTVERCDPQFKPLFLQVRDSAGEGRHRLSEARVSAGQLVLNAVVNGKRKLSTAPIPTDARFSFAARELFFREREAMAGQMLASVYDLGAFKWRKVTYSDQGPKRVEVTSGGFDPVVEDVRVIERIVDKRAEREWVARDLSTRLTELEGEALRALPSSEAGVERVRTGEFEETTGPDVAARTRFGDADAGWSIGKPDPSWVFEEPAVPGGGALVSIRNGPLSASVDVLLDPVKTDGVTATQAAESLQRLARSVAPDLRVTDERYGEDGRDYWMEALATTKGEKTRTLARAVVHKGRVYRLFAACPEKWFDLCKDDFETILGSLRLE